MNYPVENKDQFDKIAATLRKVDYDIAFIHSDIFYGFKFGKKLSRIQQLQAHWQALKNLIDDRPIWMPAFNYDFPKTHQFDVLTSKSQVGVLPEFFRTQVASWRSCVPIFSFSGDDKTPISHVSAIIDPFDELSLFHSLVKKNGLIIYYGTNISCSTILHYCERISGCLSYRYDKFFEGKVIDEKGATENMILKYHVRPKGIVLEYNWDLFECDLIRSGSMLSFDDDKFHIKIIKAQKLVEYWLDKLNKDKLSLLNQKTKEWVSKKLDELGRSFQLSDFE